MSKLSAFTILLVLVASDIFLGVQSGDPACSLTPGVEGPCRADFQRYSFYGSSCKLFYYGGCQGNDNNFNTLEDCEKACLS